MKILGRSTRKGSRKRILVTVLSVTAAAACDERDDLRESELHSGARPVTAVESSGVDEAGPVHRPDSDALDASGLPSERASLPPIVLETFEGEAATFGDFQGKALLVNVWASWCGPCREELPRLKGYYESLDHDRVEFLAISDDRDDDAARRFVEPMRLPFPLFLGHGEVQASLRYIGLPYTLIVDYHGRIVKEIYGFGSEESWRELKSALEREMDRVSVPGPI